MEKNHEDTFSMIWDNFTIATKSILIKISNNKATIGDIKVLIERYLKLFKRNGSVEKIWLDNTFSGREDEKKLFLDTFRALEIPSYQVLGNNLITPIAIIIIFALSIILSTFLTPFFWKGFIAIAIINTISVNFFMMKAREKKKELHKKQRKDFLANLEKNKSKLEEIINYDERYK